MVFVPIIVGTILSWLGSAAISEEELTVLITSVLGLLASIAAIIFYELQKRRKKDIVKLETKVGKLETNDLARDNEMISLARSHRESVDLMNSDAILSEKRIRSEFKDVIKTYTDEINHWANNIVKREQENLDKLANMEVKNENE